MPTPCDKMYERKIQYIYQTVHCYESILFSVVYNEVSVTDTLLTNYSSWDLMP